MDRTILEVLGGRGHWPVPSIESKHPRLLTEPPGVKLHGRWQQLITKHTPWRADEHGTASAVSGLVDGWRLELDVAGARQATVTLVSSSPELAHPLVLLDYQPAVDSIMSGPYMLRVTAEAFMRRVLCSVVVLEWMRGKGLDGHPDHYFAAVVNELREVRDA